MVTMLLVVLAVLTAVAAGELVRSQCRRMISRPIVDETAAISAQLAD